MSDSAWPPLALAEWRDTCQTLHMWTQVVGKIRLTLAPKLNHWWGTALYVNARGLTTSAIPYGKDAFEIRFDFIDHRLEVCDSRGERKELLLKPQSVAAFYETLMSSLHAMNIDVAINTKPQEVADPTS